MSKKFRILELESGHYVAQKLLFGRFPIQKYLSIKGINLWGKSDARGYCLSTDIEEVRMAVQKYCMPIKRVVE
jgi:hypothetical protein